MSHAVACSTLIPCLASSGTWMRERRPRVKITITWQLRARARARALCNQTQAEGPAVPLP